MNFIFIFSMFLALLWSLPVNPRGLLLDHHVPLDKTSIRDNAPIPRRLRRILAAQLTVPLFFACGRVGHSVPSDSVLVSCV